MSDFPNLTIEQAQAKRIEFLEAELKEKNQVVDDMRRILKYCARGDQGTFYQQQSARAMAYENRLVLWQMRDGEDPM